MSQFSPYYPPTPQQYGQGYAPQPHRGNGAAIASLVFGLLGCVPLLCGLLAILFGFIGLRKTRDPSVGGKGIAIAGLILGVISLLGWGITLGISGPILYATYTESQPARAVAERFLKDVSAGKIDSALTNSSGFTSTQLQTNSEQMAQFGTFQSINFNSFNYKTMNGSATMELGGTGNFSGGSKHCTFTLVRQGTVYKVIEYWVK